MRSWLAESYYYLVPSLADSSALSQFCPNPRHPDLLAILPPPPIFYRDPLPLFIVCTNTLTLEVPGKQHPLF